MENENFEIALEEPEEEQLCSGIFWILSDNNDLGQFILLEFLIPCDYNGTPKNTHSTEESRLEAVRKNAKALGVIHESLRTYEFCVEAMLNETTIGQALEYVPDEFKTKEFLLNCMRINGRALEFVPDKYMTKELFFEAVRQDGHALKFVDVSKVTKEEYTEICRLAFTRRNEKWKKTSRGGAKAQRTQRKKRRFENEI